MLVICKSGYRAAVVLARHSLIFAILTGPGPILYFCITISGLLSWINALFLLKLVFVLPPSHLLLGHFVVYRFCTSAQGHAQVNLWSYCNTSPDSLSIWRTFLRIHVIGRWFYSHGNRYNVNEYNFYYNERWLVVSFPVFFTPLHFRSQSISYPI